MKKLNLIIAALIVFTASAFAQTAYNPFTQNIRFSPEPTAFGFECGTTPEVVFVQGLTTAADATQWQTNPLTVTVSIGGFKFDGTDPATFVTGSYASNFDWEIDSFAPNTLIGTQKQTLPGTGNDPIFPNPLASGEIRVRLKVPEVSPIGSVLSVNVNLQVPGYMAQFNSQPDDSESTTTQTFCPLRITGTLYYDTLPLNNSIHGTESWPVATPSGTPVYVHLIGPGGTVVAVSQISATGTYEFTNVTPNTTYTLAISTKEGTVGQLPPTIELPDTWVHTGEDCCDQTGTDGSPDGSITVSVTNFTRVNLDFGIYSPTPTGPLYTEYKNFYATEYNCNGLLTWTTTQEINTSHTEILRKDAGSFAVIGKVNAAGNSSSALNYSFVDNTVKQGVAYEYKLRFVDIDGKSTESVSKSLQVSCNLADQSIVVFPNPAKDWINVAYVSDAAGSILEIDVVDMAGRKIMSKAHEVTEGNNVITMDLSSVAIGNYFVRYSIAELAVKGSVKFFKD